MRGWLLRSRLPKRVSESLSFLRIIYSYTIANENGLSKQRQISISLEGGIVTYKSPILLKGAHDNIIVNLVDTSPLKFGGSVDKAGLDELKQSGLNAKEKMGSS